MRATSFGSLNIDRTYRVPHVVVEGETLGASEMSEAAGGKGLNQAIALASAGLETSMAGQVGPDGAWLLQLLAERGVDAQQVRVLPDSVTGQAIIQVDDAGANCIIVYPGANSRCDARWAGEVIRSMSPGDLVVFQNEMAGTAEVIRMAKRAGLQVALNPSPIDDAMVADLPSEVDFLFVNEGEGHALTGLFEPELVLDALADALPSATIVLTLGPLGAWATNAEGRVFVEAVPAPVVDTTGAGDTFTGFFLAEYLRGSGLREALRVASLAAAMAVSRPGAADAIPTCEEVALSAR